MHWGISLAIANLISAALLLLMQWRNTSKVREAINRSDGSVEFTRDPLAYLVLPTAVLLPAWAAFNDYQRHTSGRIWNLLILDALLFAAAVELFRLPGTVAVVYDGLVQRFWLRGEKRIRWGEIAEIKDGVFGGFLTITGTDGTKIVYSDQLADRVRFLEELEGTLTENCRRRNRRAPFSTWRADGSPADADCNFANTIYSASTVLASTPRPAMETSTRSPGLSGPTPEGVPVRMRSPGSSVKAAEM